MSDLPIRLNRYWVANMIVVVAVVLGASAWLSSQHDLPWYVWLLILPTLFLLSYHLEERFLSGMVNGLLSRISTRNRPQGSLGHEPCATARSPSTPAGTRSTPAR